MIARNALLNLAGHAAPLAAALIAFPALVARLEPDRLGFLSLAWVLVGYFSLFDLGLGRALSRLVAERIGTPGEGRLPELSRTALGLTAALGAGAGILLFATAGPVCESLLRLPADLQAEAVAALRVLALCLPLVTLTAALRGLLEAAQRFGWLNAIRIPLGVLSFLAPLAATSWSTSLVALAAVLAVLRVAACAAHWIACRRLVPGLTHLGAPTRAAIREMLGYGAWLTVSNVIGPLMVYLDRFVIGAVLAVSAVAYYSAPYEVITRLWIVPAALTGVLFPALAAASSTRLLTLYRAGVKAILVSVFPVALAAALLAPEWMRLWLGAEYAEQGARAAQWLSLGVMLNCLAYLPFTLMQARGRADVAAKIHLAELPFYLALLALLVHTHGIPGAAFAWALRCAADAGLLFGFARRHVPEAAPLFTGSQQTIVALVLLALVGALAPLSLGAKGIYLALVLAGFAASAWCLLLDASERALARQPMLLLAGERR